MSVSGIGELQSLQKVQCEDEKKEGASNKPIDFDFQRVEAAIYQSISNSKATRLKRLERLGSEFSEQLMGLERSLTPLLELSLKNCDLELLRKDLDNQLYPSSDDSNSVKNDEQTSEVEQQLEQVEERIDQVNQEMKNCISDILKKHGFLELEKEFFSDFWTLNRVDRDKQKISTIFIQEQMINRCINRKFFLLETKNLIEVYKKDIVAHFFQQDSSTLNFEDLKFDLFPEGSETHNRGKVPTRISFRVEKDHLFSIFFKPRDAHIDSNIIKLFGALNALPTKQKSLDVFLPVYLILNLSHKEIVFSLWEFIDGEKMQGAAASEIVKQLDPSQRENFNNKLLRLESICRFLEISDLTLDNIIFKNIGQTSVQIIPIDLESVQTDKPTGLYITDPEMPPLTEDEITMLKISKQSIKDIPFRFVPLPTSHFIGGLARCDSFVELGNVLWKAIKEKGCTPSVTQIELEFLILDDFIHNDVPYLTEYRSKIYYGLHTNGKEIASNVNVSKSSSSEEKKEGSCLENS